MWGCFYKLISTLHTVHTISHVCVANVIKAYKILLWKETFKLMKENISLQNVEKSVLTNSVNFYVTQIKLK